jgi:hypothetical protein
VGGRSAVNPNRLDVGEAQLVFDVGEDYLGYGAVSPEVMELQWFLKSQGKRRAVQS